MKSRLIVAVLVVTAAFALSGCGFIAGTTVSSTEQLPADGITTLVVDNDNGEVIVQASQTDDNVISVNYQLRNEADIDFSVTREGNRVIVRAEDNSGPLDTAVANLTIRLPAQIVVDASTGNGRVEITGMRSSVDASTGNGSMTLGDVEGPANISTGNGSIEVDGLLGDLDAATGNGSIAVRGHVGRVEVNSGNGSIEYEGSLVESTENRLTTGNGTVSIELTGDASVDFDLETEEDQVTVNGNPTAFAQLSEGRATGLFGMRGSEASLVVRTGNGDITLTHEPTN